MIVRELGDLSILHGLVAESESERHRFVRRYFETPVALVLGAFDDSGAIAGTCGLDPDPYAADPTVGRVRHLYVRPSFRRRGVGRLLVETVVERARARFDVLTLRTDLPDADAFYRALGFSAASARPSTTHELRLTESRRAPRETASRS